MLVVILAVALANFFVGSFLGPQTEISQARGYIGYSRMIYFSLHTAIF
jgi:solute carrier family 12 sodium/potassium/chloride transporter 2